MKIIRRRKN